MTTSLTQGRVPARVPKFRGRATIVVDVLMPITWVAWSLGRQSIPGLAPVPPVRMLVRAGRSQSPARHPLTERAQ